MNLFDGSSIRMDLFEQLVLENMVVLYVEDDNVTRAFISKELKNNITHLYTAKDGLEALTKFYEYKPNIIITDLVMPDMTGVQLAKELRGKGVNCPIIVTTSVEDTKSILELVELGIEKYIIKPIKIEELMDAIVKIGKKYIFFETEKYINNRGILLDKDKQKHIESIFRSLCTNYFKELFGKGPRKVEVIIKGRDIEIKIIDSLTQIERNLIKYGYDYRMINFNRNFLYNAVKEDLQIKISELCNMKMTLTSIDVNTKMNYDKIIFTFES